MTISEICETENRREQIRTKGNWNGLDYIEVGENQRSLTVYFLRKAPAQIRKENIHIEGRRQVTNIKAVGIDLCRVEDVDRDDCMHVDLDRCVDYSTYRFCLIEVNGDGKPVLKRDEDGQTHFQPMSGFDPRYACIEFSFAPIPKEPSDMDCALTPVCPPKVFDEPEIDYLAKDYASFRQLILDRLALIMPNWQERHVPDLGSTLVELLAYVGDQLSYHQDAVATEAYLDTARQRISVRRHARLVDYFLHEGCNARAWVCIETNAQDQPLNLDEISFITRRNDGTAFGNTLLKPDDLRGIPRGQYEVFEPVTLTGKNVFHVYAAHNVINFYTWGNQECCLPRGSTSATLYDSYLLLDATTEQNQPNQAEQGKNPATNMNGPVRKLHNLKKGDVLIFEEMVCPKTGDSADANPQHRHAVRLTKVTRDEDRLNNQPVVEIEWDREDALPFPFCLSAVTSPPKCEYKENISVAHGNVILVDHGRTLGRIDLNEKELEILGQVLLLKEIPSCPEVPCPTEVETNAKPFNAKLLQRPLTFATFIESGIPAARLLTQDPRQALPAIRLRSHSSGQADTIEWHSKRDLFDSGSEDYDYVVEMDDDGFAHLRFGDGDLGHLPQADTEFDANYRIGNGLDGNVGADAIAHIVFRNTRFSDLTLTPRNPMPAAGGTAPEPIQEAKLFAPYAFRNDRKRAITAEDYAEIAGKDDPRVQRAAAALRWTGSWYEALVAIDQEGNVEPDNMLLNKIATDLRTYQRLGYDLVVKSAQYVSLEIELTVCVQPEYLAGHVKAAVFEVLSNRRLSSGQLGFFHPDNLTFGEGVFKSKLIAVVRAVPGVEDIRVEKFKRKAEPADQQSETSLISFGPLEVARLDNDPDYPENGTLKIKMEGGR